MNTDTKINLLKICSLLLVILAIPIIFFQFQNGELLETLQSFGYLLCSLAVAIQPRAFLASPDDPKVKLEEFSIVQKSMFAFAIVLIALPFLAWYITGFSDIG